MWEGFYLEDPCELTFANTLLLSNAAISLGNAFINLEISSEYIIFFTLWSFFLSSLFISLQIKEFRILALSINDSLYSSLFFFLTGLHFFHLSIGLILLIYLWSAPLFPIHTRRRREGRTKRGPNPLGGLRRGWEASGETRSGRNAEGDGTEVEARDRNPSTPHGSSLGVTSFLSPYSP